MEALTLRNKPWYVVSMVSPIKGMAMFCIFMLWFASVFDPVGGLWGLRYIALVSSIALVSANLVIFFSSTLKLSYRLCLSIYLTVIMPVYGLCLYSTNASMEPLRDTSYIAAGVLMLTSYTYSSLRLCEFGVKAMVFSLRLLTAIILTLFIFIVAGLDSSWIAFFTEADTALVSTREYAGVELPYIYFLASPMLIYLIAYDLYKFSWERSFCRAGAVFSSSLAFLLSGTRAHMVLAIIFPVLYYSLMYPRNKRAVALMIVGGAAFLMMAISSDIVAAFFSKNETSNSMKLGMFSNYAEIFSNIFTFVFGQGYNAYEWSTHLRSMIVLEDYATKTELTYVELIRVYGFLVSAPFFLMIIGLIKKTSNFPEEYRWLYPAFSVYLLNSALNPYFFSTNGILPLALICSFAFFLNKSSITKKMKVVIDKV